MGYIILMNETQKGIVEKAHTVYCHMVTGDFQALIDDFVANSDKLYDAAQVELAKKSLCEIRIKISNQYDTDFPYIFSPKGHDWELCLDETALRWLGFLLDTYSRFMVGQWKIVGEIVCDNCDDLDFVGAKFDDARGILIPSLRIWPCASLGISNKCTPREGKVAYEMFGVIRHKLWLDSEHRTQYTAASNLPMELSGEPFLKIERL